MKAADRAPYRSVTYGQPLNGREQQALAALAAGKSNAQIAADLHLSVETVKTHLRTLFRKLGADNRVHAVAIAHRNGLLKDGAK